MFRWRNLGYFFVPFHRFELYLIVKYVYIDIKSSKREEAITWDRLLGDNIQCQIDILS